MDLEPDQPQLYSTRTRSAWKLPALGLAALIVGLVAVTRLGAADVPPRSTPPTAVAAAPNPRATPRPTPPFVVTQLPGVMPRSPDGLTYADGIPTGISGQSVYRVRDALQLPLGRTVLVGGWYLARNCRPTGRGAPLCPTPTISDVPLQKGMGDVRTDFIALDSRLAGTGAHIVLATVANDPVCAIYGGGGICQPRLKVLQQVWSAVG